jgi:outer membrane protein assembly factor BamB
MPCDLAAKDPAFTTPKLNCAPAVGRGTVYVVIRKTGSSEGVLVGLDALTLKPKYKTKLLDPKTGNNMYVDEDGTSCPMIAPDGDVYFGALESPFGHHGYRGWLLHFSGNLLTQKTPGAFGWDDTPSIVPARIVPSYKGESTYLILCKYNKYVQGGGEGNNMIALLDPSQGALEASSGVFTMKEVMTVLGPTPDQDFIADHPNAVREWCVNTAAVDVTGKCAILNCEDGHCYRWNFATGDLADGIQLTDGLGQAYTSTVIGAKGEVFAISNAKIFAIGKNP